jgi:hypothetical protein
LKKENDMKRFKFTAGKFGIWACGVLLGGAASAQPSVEVGISVPLPTVAVEIHATSDFYEPLTSYGRWQDVGSYGRCWIPGRVEAGWRPYSEGHWQQTDAGWYWVSDEPWGWATYHYGRWDMNPEFGWFWVPQVEWAPAWVSWHSGGGYIGWSPMFTADVRVEPSRSYVFVEERHFMDPVRHASIIIDNPAIINRAMNTRGPESGAIEKASGRKFQTVPVRDLRRTEEAPVAARQSTPAATRERTAQPPVRSEIQPAGRNPVAVRETQPPGRPAPVAREFTPPVPGNARGLGNESRGPVPVRVESQPVSRPVVRTEARPEVRPETRPEVKPETRPTVRPETRPEVKPETRPTARPETRPEVRPEARPVQTKEQKPAEGKTSGGEKNNDANEKGPR